jgi:hypothetical protein
MGTNDQRGGPAAGPMSGWFLVGVAVPLALVVLAYVLWWISDRLLYIGPLDRAAFGWSVVIPIWIAAPVAAGFAWRGLTRTGRDVAAVVVGTVIGIATTVLLWQSIAFPDCQFGPSRTPAELVVPSLIVGFVIGGGQAGTGLLVSSLVRQGRPWRAAALGAAVAFGLVFAAILVASAVLPWQTCNRPTVGLG